MGKKRYTVSTSETNIINPTWEDINEALNETMKARSNAHACILESGKDDYIQTVFDEKSGQWRLEYREPKASGYRHFYAHEKGKASAFISNFEIIRSAFNSFFKNTNWTKALQWVRYEKLEHKKVA